MSKLFTTIRWRFILIYLLITLLAFSIAFVFASRVIEDKLFSQHNEESIREINDFSVQISGYLENNNAAQLNDMAVSKGQDIDGRVLVLNEIGTVVVDTFSELNGRRLNMREVVNVLIGETDTAHGFHKTDGPDGSIWSAYYTSAVISDSGIVGVVLFSESVEDIVAQMRNIQIQYVEIFAAVVIVVMLLSYILTNHISRPLEQITENANSIAQGDFSKRVNAKGKDEIAKLANAFDRMSERLETLDRQRSEFVSNASHELKTPLTSMKILTESILYQDGIPEEVYKDFLTDMNGEIDRLTKLINEFLMLTKLEGEEADAAEFKPVPMVQLAERAVKMLRPIAETKGVELTLEYADNLSVECEEEKLLRAVSNLVENGIKYTPAGGRVAVFVRFADGYGTISVKDTGEGIPKEDIGKIFERFYRVDKARARQTGGNGLGLYIVLMIARRHNGRVEVSSKEGVGTEFRLILPLKHGGGEDAK